MALGGGTFLTQNKVLPGVYINIVSVSQASAALADRGTVTMPFALNWGPEREMFTVERGEFIKNSRKIFGYDYTAPELLPLRELFAHATKAHLFRLEAGGKKAQNAFAEAKYPGTRGNSLRVVVEESKGFTQEAPLYDVSTYLGAARVEKQERVVEASALVPNDYLDWKENAQLEPTAGAPLAGGENGTVEDGVYQEYLDQAERFSFNAMGCPSADTSITKLFAAYCRQMREETGKKFQVVCFRTLADYEGVVSVKNGLKGDVEAPALVPWVTGVIGGTAVNHSATNMTYDGEYEPDIGYTQAQLEGSFMLHRVDDKTTVLEDVNSFVSATDEKSADFASNQTIRVLDQIANDIAVLFAKKYIGKVPNDDAGRVSLWNDIVKHHTELQDIRAIENFSGDNVTVEQGDTKKAVVVNDYVTPVNAMAQLYMTVWVQ